MSVGREVLADINVKEEKSGGIVGDEAKRARSRGDKMKRGSYDNSVSGKIVIEDNVKRKLINVLMMPAKRVPVSRTLVQEEKEKFRNYVSVSMDLNRAQKRINSKLGRVSYFMRCDGGDKPRSIFEKIDENGRVTGDKLKHETGPRTKKGSSVKLHYHEGPNYLEFEREKNGVEGINAVSRERSIELVRDFIKNVKLINETNYDKIRSIDVDNVSSSEEMGREDREAGDVNYVMEQSVNLRRAYRGIPVINSSMRVAFTPGNNEIIQVVKRHWTPLVEEGDITVKAEYSAEEARQLAKEVGKELKSAIAEGNVVFQEALVNNVEYVYWQAESGLQPLLYFEFSYMYKGIENEINTQPGVVLIDPYKRGN